MSNDTDTIDQQPITSPRGQPTAEEILENAQSAMATISELVEKTKAVTISAEEAQKQIVVAHAESQAKLSEITNTTTQAIAAKTKISDEQAVIATKSDHIQKAQEHADKVRENLDRVLTAATQQGTAAEGQNSRAKTAADSAAALLLDIQKRKGTVETDSAAIVTSRKTAEDSTAQIKGLAGKSAEVETRIAKYEQRLAELEQQCAIQLKTITELLPGATSTGLAHAFDDRRKTFLKPHNRWQWIFVGSLLAIIALTISGLWILYHNGPGGALSTTPSYDEVLRMWLSRLPVAGALIWLALHASQESALAKRLEEDYGYKSAIAASFLGFHNQMTEIGSKAESNKPLAKLCGDTLATIACPPGRIYDNHKLTVTPADELANAAKAAASLANAAKPSNK